jgi:hypothetical protein
VYETIPLFELTRPLELGGLLALTRLEIALLPVVLRSPLLIRHLRGARLRHAGLLDFLPLRVYRRAWVAGAGTLLNLG